MKTCKKCKLSKSVESFSKKSDNKDKLSNYCKDCDRIANKKKWEENKDSISERNKKNYERNKDNWKEKQKEYYLSNRDEILIQKKDYHNKNKNKILENKKLYYELNKDIVTIKNHRYYELNRNKILKNNSEWKRNKLKNDDNYKLSHYIRGIINSGFIRKNLKKNLNTEKILGCSFEEFKLYLESKFEAWMTWENRGLYNGELEYGWDVDHIIPISLSESEEDLYKLNHYTNLQPLCSYLNRCIKRNVLK